MNKQPARKNGLGKGITSLLGDLDFEPTRKPAVDQGTRVSGASASNSALATDKTTAQKTNITSANFIDIPIDSIVVNPHQPRRIFNESELKNLAASIKVDGIIQPLTVTKTNSPGKYTLIAGERRLRASRLAGLTKVPVIIREAMTDQEQLRVALIENIQRQDLNVIEEAEAYHALINDFGLTQEQCADKVGKERSTVANTLRMVNLPREVQDDLVEGRLTMGHGRALLSLEDKKIMLRVRDIVIKKALNVRQTEELCKNYKNPAAPGPQKTLADLEYLCEGLRTSLKTKVKISGNGVKGKIEVSYFSAPDLERLLGLMGHKLGTVER
jgi:ParB family transcriptional regulator, chromosome partitioning protein